MIFEEKNCFRDLVIQINSDSFKFISFLYYTYI